MNKNEEQFYMVNKFLKYRNDVIKYIWSAICLVVILSLLGNAIMTIFSEHALIVLILSLVSLGFAFFFSYFKRILSLLDQEKEYKGNVFYNKQSKKVLSLQGYFFSDKINEYMEGILAENAEIARKWKKSSLNPKYITNCFEVLGQAVDYYIIERLETTLYDFFDNYSNEHKDIKIKEIKRYKRQDFLPLFAENEFFKLFTKSMGRRDPFKKGHESIIARERKIHYARAVNGAYYSYFEMPLPKDAHISKDPEDRDILVKIKTKQLEVRIWRRVYIEESCYVPLDIFLYSNSFSDNEYLDINAIEVDVKIQVKFNRWRNCFYSKMDDYQWVDKLNSNLENCFDINKFKSEMKHKSFEYLFEKISNMEKNLEKNLRDIRLENQKTRRIHY